MLPYSVVALDGFTAMPNEPDKARISRSPESSGLGGVVVMSRSWTSNFTQS